MRHTLADPNNLSANEKAIKNLADEYLKQNGVKLKGAFTIMSPPAEMKNNGSVVGGRKELYIKMVVCTVVQKAMEKTSAVFENN